MKTFTLLVIVFLIAGGNLVAVPPQRFPANYPKHIQRVRFHRGKTTTVIRGVARTPGIYEWVLQAKAGQHLTVHLTSSNKGVEFSIFAPKDDNSEYPLGVYDWEGDLNTSGKYQIVLINNREGGPRNPTYTLEVTVR
ncbi:MAG: hypothetical protein AABM67_20420 [Acidobacteriota bacterium]